MSYERIHKLCFSCGRIGHWRENCLYTVRGENIEREKEDKPEGEQVVHSCISHEARNYEQKERTTLGVQEDIYGPWIVVAWRKHGTKTRRGNGIDPGKIQGHNLKVHEASVNETRLDADVGKVAPNSGSPREGKEIIPYQITNGPPTIRSSAKHH